MIQQVYSFLVKEEMKIYALIKLQIHAYNTFIHTVQNLGTLKMSFFQWRNGWRDCGKPHKGILFSTKNKRFTNNEKTGQSLK